MHKKRRPLSLLEVIIALSLTATLLIILFGMFREITVANIEVESLQEKFFVRERMQMRLTQLFSEHETEKSNEPIFYLDSSAESLSPRLTLSVRAKIDRDPEFCVPLKAELFLSKKKNLELALSPLEEGKGRRNELLMENVHRVFFLLFDLKERKWVETWSKEKKESPTMVKMVVETEKKEKIEFAFFLPSSQNPVELTS
jgi:type II secretory pathway component PulJ